jgi:hypothetical protein
VNGVVLWSTYLTPGQRGPVRGDNDDDCAFSDLDEPLDVFGEAVDEQFALVV